jgi:transcriptional regulator GlxA family with amidase domain
MSNSIFQAEAERPAGSRFASEPAPAAFAETVYYYISDREAAGAEKIRQSIEFMKQHLDQPLQAATLAARVNISQSHYFALFKRVTGQTPIDYFIRLRIERACALLTEASASVKGVAAAVGYDDPFYFSRVFRSVQGIAPSGYRAMNAESNLRAANSSSSMQFGSRNTGLRRAEYSPSKA